jgi:hypothetical protein
MAAAAASLLGLRAVPAAEVRRVLRFPALIEAMAEGLDAFSHGRIEMVRCIRLPSAPSPAASSRGDGGLGPLSGSV